MDRKIRLLLQTPKDENLFLQTTNLLSQYKYITTGSKRLMEFFAKKYLKTPIRISTYWIFSEYGQQ